MKKIRIYEIARKLKTNNAGVLAVISAMGIEVKSHMSLVDQATAEKIVKKYKMLHPGVTCLPAGILIIC